MTLVLTIHSRNYLWVVTDRRLSYGGRRPPIDDAVKIMELSTGDGHGLLAYAGLGATSRGTQPSEWMSAVLRGQGGMTFERTLGVLADAASRELPRHLAALPGGAHFIVAPAFVHGVGARLYSIDNVVDAATGRHWSRYTSHQRWLEPGAPSLTLGLAGTGGSYLAKRVGAWKRELQYLVKKNDLGRISDSLMADHLARLNYQVHQAVPDTVGPRSIVVWRRRRGSRQGARNGGGHHLYTGVDREPNSAAIPMIGSGRDMRAVVSVLQPWFERQFQRHFSDPASPAVVWDQEEMNRMFAGLPYKPDDRLR